MNLPEPSEGEIPLMPPADTPAKTFAITTGMVRLSEKAGDRIGRYKLLQQIGEGGCGVVYMAEQEEPVRRRVAVKVIKLGMDTKQVIARFEAERQALALMDHPNIAKVFDAGSTERPLTPGSAGILPASSALLTHEQPAGEDAGAPRQAYGQGPGERDVAKLQIENQKSQITPGRPYFVMELVRGIRITDYCDQNKLSTGERLKLFVQVCHAIQHAHQKGIIHRDIKPSNILVTLHDGVPVPKVIDFGIAKATQGRLTDQTLFTAFEQFIGTPAYMSPEQAEMSGLDIDTRCDIYALGVLLYELLTGQTPFDARELVASGLDKMRQTIREKEPERPSSRLTQELVAASRKSAADLAEENSGALSTSRRYSPTKELIRLLRGDLDWVVMKALEKDRTRRYETANGLAMDIRRYLSNEPVIARPPSNLYRLQKLVRRNKTLFAAMAALAAALVIGLGLSLYLFLRERDARQRAVAAEREQARLRQQAEEGRAIGEKLTMAGLALSRNRFEEAEKIVNQVSAHPAAAAIFNVLGVVHAHREQWSAAIPNFAKVIEFIPTDHQAYHALAPLLLQNGDREAYQRLRERILAQFGQTSNPVVAERMAKDCLIIPPAAANLVTIGKMADTAVAAGSNHEAWEYFEFVKGLSEYRQGHFPTAVEWLGKIDVQNGDLYRSVQTQMVLAMAQHQLKQVDEARATLAKGLQSANTRLPKAGQGALDEQWNDWIIAHLLMREAQALIEGATK